MNIDLNRLKIFCHVYANQSVSKAARELRLTQPAVSQHLKKLEKELRIPLFTRMHKRIIPTPAATRLFERMAPFIDELQEELKYLRRPLDTPYGLLRMGAPFSFGSNYLPLICNHFRLRFPTVTFKFDFGSADRLLKNLSEGTLDFVLTDSFSTEHAQSLNPLLYRCEPFLDEHLVMACSAQFFSRKVAGNTEYAHLATLEYLCCEGSETLIDQWFSHHFRKWPDTLNFALTTNNQQSMLEGARCGMGLGLLPDHLIKNDLEAGRMVKIAGKKNQLTNRLLIVQLQNKEVSLTEKAFLDFFKKQSKRLHSQPADPPVVEKPARHPTR